MDSTLTEPTLESPPTAESRRAAVGAPARARRIALVGNPNAGKTTLFNTLTGLRAKTANFPGTTLEIRLGRMLGHRSEPIELVDMPGLYSLQAQSAEERVALEGLLGGAGGHPAPAGVVLLLDATHLERNLFLASQVRETGIPMVAALNLIDIADRIGLKIDADALAAELGCPVVPISARKRTGIEPLRRRMNELIELPGETGNGHAKAPAAAESLKTLVRGQGAPAEHRRFDWAESVGRRCILNPGRASARVVETLDRILTHPVQGLIVYLAVMAVVFYLIFTAAAIPMGIIETIFASGGSLVARILPEGQLQSLIVDGIIGGVGGVVVFLPQICLIFFCLTLLEDSGYLARAALVMDRLMQRVGLPGKAFVPMLSAHACAIPAIMSTKIIEDKRDRLVTILILPLLTCSARLPVYAMVTALLFPTAPLKAALVFMGAYFLGLAAAVSSALLLRRTILPGKTHPLVIELPDFRMPGLRQALLTTWDRACVFIKRAGTTILAISIVLWWLSSYPRLTPEAAAAGQGSEAVVAATGVVAQPPSAVDSAFAQEQQLAYSFAGRAGRVFEPVFAPLGFDWRIGVGVISSFAAREVIVATMSILYGLGGDEDQSALTEQLRAATRDDGSPLFTLPVCMSLLVFFVLAMQCLPTQVITRRETGAWRWAALQFGYMTALAYVAALITFQGLTFLGY